MTRVIEIGTARSMAGTAVYGAFDAVPLPTGGIDTLPVIIVQGPDGGDDGPVLWLTANIHGGECNGLATIHHLMTPDLPRQMRGTLVAIPSLSPAGLRTGERSPYYLHGRDPNRLFPSFWDAEPVPLATRSRAALEETYAALFDHIGETADFLVDLHDYGADAIPFIFRDPVLYRSAHERSRALKLQNRVGQMVAALGLTVVNEYVTGDYLKLNLHRSVSGATLNSARIPAVTVEIGGQRSVNKRHVAALASSVRNLMRWAKMLPGPAESLGDVPVLDLGFAVRRTTHPRASEACIIEHLCRPGDVLRRGDAIARMRDIYGRPVGRDDGLLRVESEGFVLGLFPGIAFYPNDPVAGLAIRDSGNMVIHLSE